MKLSQSFNTQSLPQSDNSYDVVPAGWYQASIVSAEVKDTKSGTGQYINVRYQITGPEHSGRNVFGMINIRNANPKAESIGHQQLGELMRAIGLDDLEDTDQLTNAQMAIKVTVSESEQYGNRNEVRGWKAVEAPKPATSASGSKSAPWLRK